MSARRMFTVWDAVMAGVLVLLCATGLWFFAARPAGGVAVIEQNGVEITRVALAPNQKRAEVTLPGAQHTVIVIENGAAWFEHSDCPDRICVRTGKLTQSGQVAACLPAGVVLHIEGAASEQDAITGN